MTRRHLSRLFVAAVAGAPACSTTNRETRAQLIATCETGGFAIFGARQALDSANMLVPSAITVAGADAGQLQLPTSPRPHPLALAPDGAWIAWVPESSLPDPYDRGGRPVVCLTDNPKSSREVRYKGSFGGVLALSAGARRLAIIAWDRDGRFVFSRLLVLDPATGETVGDLTRIVANSDRTINSTMKSRS